MSSKGFADTATANAAAGLSGRYGGKSPRIGMAIDLAVAGVNYPVPDAGGSPDGPDYAGPLHP